MREGEGRLSHGSKLTGQCHNGGLQRLEIKDKSDMGEKRERGEERKFVCRWEDCKVREKSVLGL